MTTFTCDNCGAPLIHHRVYGVVHANGQWYCYPGYSLNELEHAALVKGIIDDLDFLRDSGLVQGMPVQDELHS